MTYANMKVKLGISLLALVVCGSLAAPARQSEKKPKGSRGRSELAPGHSEDTSGQSTEAPWQSTVDQEQSTEGPGQRTVDQEQSTEGPGQSTVDQEQSTEAPGQNTVDQGHSTDDQRHSTIDQGHSTIDQGQSTIDQGQSTVDQRGQTTYTPGQSKAAPGRSADAPGQSADSRGQSADSRGQSADAPGQSADSRGQSANSPGQSADAPGQSANSPGRSADAPGQDNPKGKKMESDADIEDYLSQFYGLARMPAAVLGNPKAVTGHMAARRQALRRLQRKAGLPQTGEVDQDTVAAMELPRCGVSSAADTEDGGDRRRRRFAARKIKWEKKDLTYKFLNFSPDMDVATQESETSRALNIWAEVTPLTFTRVTSGSADIEISFVEYEHGDPYPFDGPGTVLAHAFYPGYGGDTHMDDAEKFSAFSVDGTNMFQVMAHEFGHSLGLEHSDIQSALMVAFYRGYVPNFQLNTDDVAGIQSLYGVRQTGNTHSTTPTTTTTRTNTPSTTTTRTNTPTTTTTRTNTPTTTTTRTNTRATPTTTSRATVTRRPTPSTTTPSTGGSGPCSLTGLDTITNVAGTTYVFNGSQYMVLDNNGVAEGYPRDITFDLGLPSDLDASLTTPEYRYYQWSGSWYRYMTGVELTYFFKGSLCWKFANGVAVSGFPRAIGEEFPGLPDDLDAAFVWSGNGRYYFIKGGQYYQVTYLASGVDLGHPRDLSVWNLPISSIDAALQSPSGKTYFFSGDKYYSYNDYEAQVDTDMNYPYPRSTATWWLGCPNSDV